MDEQLLRGILGSITDADPVKRAVVIGPVTAAIVQWLVKPWVTDDRWYSIAAVLVAVALAVAAAAVTDGAYAVAALYGIVIGTATAGTVNAIKRLRKPAGA